MTQYDEHRTRYDRMSSRQYRRTITFWTLVIVAISLFLLGVLIAAVT